MKIGFTGSQGTGKTSLAEALVKIPNFSDYDFVTSAVRDANSAGNPVNQEATRLSQMVITTARLVKEEKAFRNSDNIISDRMLIDSFAYTSYQMEAIWIDDPTDGYYMDLSRDLALLSAAKYDKVFFFPAYWEPIADGVRVSDRNYQLCVSDVIESFLDQEAVPHLVVPDFSVEERVEWIDYHVTKANRFHMV